MGLGIGDAGLTTAFKVGDRVYHKDYGEGTVICKGSSVSIGVCFDKKNCSLHSLHGLCEHGHGWFCLAHKLTKIGGNKEWD